MAEPVVGGGLVYVSTEVPGSSDGHVFALDARTGVEQWRFATDVAKVGPVALSGGAVYLSTGDVVALDAVTGEVRWRQAVAGAGFVAAGTDVVVASTPTGLAALDPVTGGPRWELAMPALSAGPPSVATDVVVSDDGAGNLVGLDPATGAARWRSPVSRVLHAPVVGGNLAVVATTGGVVAVDARSGERHWQRDRAGEILRVATDGTVVAAVAAERLELLDVKSGEVVGRSALDPDVPAQPVVAGGRVYVAMGEVVEALDRPPS